jgi:PPM family protein phosphatase
VTPPENRLPATVAVAEAPLTHAAAAATRLGLDRDRNKDAWWAPESSIPPERLTAKGYLYVVCDGSGGQVTGGLSQSIVALVASHYYEDPDLNAATSLAHAMSAANAEIFHRDAPALQSGVGLTIVAGVFRGQEWVVGSLGDGRVFLLRDGALRCLTMDYSWLEQADASPTEEAGGPASRSPTIKSDTWPDIPTDLWPDVLAGLQPSGLGSLQPNDQPGLRLDNLSSGVHHQRGVQPEVKSILAQPGDRLLLCTYGVWGVVPEDQVRRALMWPTPEQATAMLMDRVAMLSGQEDATALVLTLQAEKKPTPPRRATPLWLLALLPVAGAVAASLLLLQVWGTYPPEPVPSAGLSGPTVTVALGTPLPTWTVEPTPSSLPGDADGAPITPTLTSSTPMTVAPASALTATVTTAAPEAATPISALTTTPEAATPIATLTITAPTGTSEATLAPTLTDAPALPAAATMLAPTVTVMLATPETTATAASSAATIPVTATTPGAFQPQWTATVTTTAAAEDLYCVVPAVGQTIYAWLDCTRRGPAMAAGMTFPIPRDSVTVRMCSTTFVPIQLKGQKYFLATVRIGRTTGSLCRRVPAGTFDRPR